MERLEADLSDKDRELYEIRHELVSAQVKLEENQKRITSLKEEADDYLKRIALLEARLSRGQDPQSFSADAAPGQKTEQ